MAGDVPVNTTEALNLNELNCKKDIAKKEKKGTGDVKNNLNLEILFKCRGDILNDSKTSIALVSLANNNRERLIEADFGKNSYLIDKDKSFLLMRKAFRYIPVDYSQTDRVISLKSLPLEEIDKDINISAADFPESCDEEYRFIKTILNLDIMTSCNSQGKVTLYLRNSGDLKMVVTTSKYKPFILNSNSSNTIIYDRASDVLLKVRIIADENWKDPSLE